MVIHITDSLINESLSSRKVRQVLTLIFYLFECGKHKWFIKGNDVDKIKKLKFLASFEEFIEKSVVEEITYPNDVEPQHLIRLCSSTEIIQRKDKLKELQNVSINEFLNGHRMTVYIDNIVHDFVSYNIAETFLGQPLYILVEDIESDKMFIDKCLTLVGKVDIDQIWVEYSHGGGANVCKVAKSYAGKKRLAIIVDGDQCSPSFKNVSKIKELQKVCGSYGYYLHILRKREIENYLPDSAIKKYLLSTGRPIDEHIYFNIPEEIKDFYDVKEGLCKNFLIEEMKCVEGHTCFVWNSILNMDTIEQTAIALENSQDNIKSLELGFGDKIWKAFTLVESEGELKERDSTNELEEITEKILQYI